MDKIFLNIWMWSIVGLAISLGLGCFITQRVIKCVKNNVKDKVMEYLNIDKKRVEGDEENEQKGDIDPQWKWWDQVSEFELKGGKWIGRLDIIIFFLAILMKSEIVIVGWLTFKIAAKWESWANITKVPNKRPDCNKEPYFDQVMRRWWGTLVMQRFVIGTGLNFLCAVLGVIATYGLPKLAWYITSLP